MLFQCFIPPLLEVHGSIIKNKDKSFTSHSFTSLWGFFPSLEHRFRRWTNHQTPVPHTLSCGWWEKILRINEISRPEDSSHPGIPILCARGLNFESMAVPATIVAKDNWSDWFEYKLTYHTQVWDPHPSTDTNWKVRNSIPSTGGGLPWKASWGTSNPVSLLNILSPLERG